MTSTDPEAAPAPPAEATPPAEEVAPSKRVSQTILDMVRSLGVVAVIVAVTLIFVPNLLHPGKSSRVQPANYSDDALGFRQVTGVPAYAPVGLPSGWYANGSTFSRRASVVHLHIGWVTPDKNYAGLDESNGPAASFLAAVLGKSSTSASDIVLVNGRRWAVRSSADGERSLTATLSGVAVIITGSASAAQEDQLAASLQPDTSAIH